MIIYILIKANCFQFKIVENYERSVLIKKNISRKK